jgi:hypothetical protein
MDGPRSAAVAASGAATGLVAAWIKALSEPRLQRITERLWPPTPEQKEMVGTDPAGHPDNAPPR